MKPLPTPLLQPWPITQDGMQLVLSVWSRGGLFADAREKALAARAGEPMENARVAYTRDGVCVIPVTGPLFRHASLLTDLSGATAYDDIRRDLETAVNDPECFAILFDIDSPGGEANALAELAQAIYEARDKKPVWAYVGGYGASAAYWIASACSRIVCGETALLGSIGVRIVVIDDSGAEAQIGVRTVEIVNDASPDKRATPVDEALIARLQARANGLAGIFIRDVARNRSVTAERVTSDFGRGDVLMGAAAVAAGMADALGSYEQTIGELATSAQPSAPPAPARPDLTPYGAHMDTTALEKFRADVLAATQTTTTEQALGRIAAGEQAMTSLRELQARVAEGERAQTAGAWKTALEQAMVGDNPILTIGKASRVVPTFLAATDRPAVQAALGKLTEQTVAGVLEALCSAQPSAPALESLRAFIDASGPALPTAKKEPARNAEGEATELDELGAKVKAAADAARATLDGPAAAAAKK